MDNLTPRGNRFRSIIALLIGIGLAALYPPSVALAQTAATKPAPKVLPRPTVNASVALPQLEQAYNLLASADNDYQGHRELAMKEIAGTCQLLGKKLAPTTNVKKQPLSDLQIRSVQMVLLEIGRSAPPGDNNAPVVAHINVAISQLDQGITAKRAQASANPPKEPNPSAAAGRGRGAAANRSGTRGPLVIDNPVNTNMVEVGSLEDIYETLSVANHDYKGHRVKSMNAIARVVRALGANIRGDGHGHEEQIVSDQQLQYAQFLLRQVCKSFSTNDPKAILDDLTMAYNELTTALSIK